MTWCILLAEALDGIVSARPFRVGYEATDLALIWKERLGYGDRVRIIRERQ